MEHEGATSEVWWPGAVGYCLYIRSFADSDGDGIGDLRGIIERLDYVEALGINLLWITPFYPSPMVDFGYDVANYYGVDPVFGDMADVDRLISQANDRGIKVVVDLVANHTSHKHPWFQAASADRSCLERDYYIWGDPAPDGGPPNNWVSYFGGPAWTFDEQTGQYYLHLFLPEQPDLNWRNPAVHQEFEQIVRFWLDRGVAGFRVDVAQGLVKDLELRSNPQLQPYDPDSSRTSQWASFAHTHDILQPESLDVFASWKSICHEYNAVLIGETSVSSAAELSSLLRGDGLDIGLWLEPLHIEWEPVALQEALAGPLANVQEHQRVGWVASSLDEIRAASRFGGGELGQRRALALVTLMFFLPGVPFLYQGEELGLEQGVVAPDERADPVGADVTLGRDGCRTPMPWQPGPSFGFTSGDHSWLPDGGRTDADTVAAQEPDEDSWLHRYKALVALRKNRPELANEAVEWLDFSDQGLLGFRRGSCCIVANIGAKPTLFEHQGTVIFDTHNQLEQRPEGILLAIAQTLVIEC